jgi:FMN phosphatase YigB (HAD superfamily)
MKDYTCYSLKNLIEAGRRLAKEKSVVSFDLFDTLLIRRIHDPDLVKLPVARYIAELAKERGVKRSATEIQELRDDFENEMRAEIGRTHSDHEACYPVFMKQLLVEIFGEAGEDLLADVTAYEMAMENAMLVPRKELVAWLRELSAAGKRVFIVSDMYLPAEHLEKLTDHAGLSEYAEAIVSSADSFAAKASGEGWKLMAERFDIQPADWLHIGDNPFSDGLRAKETGITPLLIHDPQEDLRKSLLRRYWNYSDGRPFWRGRLLQQVMAPLEGENIPREPLYREGYNFIGPLIGIFLQQIREICRSEKVSKIFFLSREGWTFERYWKQAMPLIYPGEELPEIEYLYVSRMALAGASCAHGGLKKESADIAFLPPGNRDFTDLCRIFSLDPEAFKEIFDRFGIEVTTCLSHIHEGYRQENRRAFERILEDEAFQREVKAQTADANAALQKYLEDVGFFSHKRVAVVDVGWLGSIQRFLVDAVSHRDDMPVCRGLLFGATRGIPFPTTEKNSISGVIYDQNRFDFAASALFYARDIFEEACRAPYPTLNGYRLSDNEKGYELIFRRTDDALGREENAQDSYFAPLQQGIYDSAARFGQAVRLLGWGYRDFKPWLNYLLVSRLAFPKTEEIMLLRNRSHLDDFHGGKQPKAAFLKKAGRELWDQSERKLRWSPLLRLRRYLFHLRSRLNQ